MLSRSPQESVSCSTHSACHNAHICGRSPQESVSCSKCVIEWLNGERGRSPQERAGVVARVIPGHQRIAHAVVLRRRA